MQKELKAINITFTAVNIAGDSLNVSLTAGEKMGRNKELLPSFLRKWISPLFWQHMSPVLHI